MKLFINPISPNSRKTLAVAAHLNLDVDKHAVDFQKAEHKSPEFLKMNPNGKVPVLTDGTFTLWESNAIIAYLASKKDSALWPKTDARYDIMRWMSWEASHWQPAFNLLIGEKIFAPMRGRTPNPETIAMGEADVKKYGAVLNGHLEGKKWLVGDDVTLADYAVAAIMMYKDQVQAPVSEYRHVVEWFGRVEALDGWKKSQAK